MPVRYTTGDIFMTPDGVALAHGCNCAGAMGKGIALEFKRRWPKMFLEYRSRCKTGYFLPGDVFEWRDPETSRRVYNLGTQKTWRSGASMVSIEKSVEAMLATAERDLVRTIAMPLIGTGLGGMASQHVKEIVSGLTQSSSIDVMVCEIYKKGYQLA